MEDPAEKFRRARTSFRRFARQNIPFARDIDSIVTEAIKYIAPPKIKPNRVSGRYYTPALDEVIEKYSQSNEAD